MLTVILLSEENKGISMFYKDLHCVNIVHVRSFLVRIFPHSDTLHAVLLYYFYFDRVAHFVPANSYTKFALNFGFSSQTLIWLELIRRFCACKLLLQPKGVFTCFNK